MEEKSNEIIITVKNIMNKFQKVEFYIPFSPRYYAHQKNPYC